MNYLLPALFPYNGTCHVNCSVHELSVA